MSRWMISCLWATESDELRQVLNSYLSGRAVNVSEPTRIIGAPGELGATKTRELSDQTPVAHSYITTPSE